MFYHKKFDETKIDYIINELSKSDNAEEVWNCFFDLVKNETCEHWYDIEGIEEIYFGEIKKSFIKNCKTLDKSDIQAYWKWLGDRNYFIFDTKSPLLSRPAAIEMADSFFEKYEFIGLIFIDLKYFKMLNDILDHETGDEYLYTVGNIIKNVCKNDDFAVRDGGDEYYIFSGDNDKATLKQRLDNIINHINDDLDKNAYRIGKINEIKVLSQDKELMNKKHIETLIDTDEIKLRFENRNCDWISPEIIGTAKTFRQCYDKMHFQIDKTSNKLPNFYNDCKTAEYRYIYALKEIEKEKNKLEEKPKETITN